MQVQDDEILFIRKHAPRGLVTSVARKTGYSYRKVNNELFFHKKCNEYNDAIIIQAREILKAMAGLEYQPEKIISTVKEEVLPTKEIK